MSKTPFDSDKSSDFSDDLLPEYHFDYRQAQPNRFASGERPLLKVVVLDDDVAQVFKNPESVNRVLRALIETMPQD